MKTIKIWALSGFMLMALPFYAQKGPNTNEKGSKTVQQSNKGNKNQKSNAKVENRTVQVQNQPQAKRVNRNQVEYQRSEPKVVAKRQDYGSPMQQVSHQNSDYYMDKGFYYRRVNGNYVRSAAPAGLRVNSLPVGFIQIVISSHPYYYYEGTYYSGSANNYEVVEPPVGAIVYSLPVDYEKVNVNGITYYEYNGVLYSKVHYQGERAYQVVGYVD